ncbi:hypothetical protein CALCODRAFT_520683 [Calocera cornea HHB12733]|uniref:Uncharacterized protein n=1 Tax=Calocera cornea HHB12733 TaxID=1353952 RepID=A0A165DCK5_9BASI|nr:hypothetical protein CALCODRAFT_520683 [Calocera cornea HHB12733]
MAFNLLHPTDRTRLPTPFLGIRVTVETVVTIEPADPFAPLLEPQLTSVVVSRQGADGRVESTTATSTVVMDIPQPPTDGSSSAADGGQGEDGFTVTSTVTIDAPSADAVQSEDAAEGGEGGTGTTITSSFSSSYTVDVPGTSGLEVTSTVQLGEGVPPTHASAATAEMAEAGDALSSAGGEGQQQDVVAAVTAGVGLDDVHHVAEDQKVGGSNTTTSKASSTTGKGKGKDKPAKEYQRATDGSSEAADGSVTEE